MTQAKLEVREGLARWTVNNLAPHVSGKESKSFKISIWTWILSVQRTWSTTATVRLKTNLSADPPPLARFTLSVTVDGLTNSTVHDGPLDDFAFPFDFLTSEFQIAVDFSELKISPFDGGDDISIWPIDDRMRRRVIAQSTFKCFSRMLNESLFTDITINTADGKVHAHRVVLSASSPVFHSMFVHDLKEKQSSTIEIEDMTSESCTALISCIYGTISKEDFGKHRMTLMAAANKYNIPDLKDACEESLIQDIDLKNVLERLQKAWLYQLNKLKKACMTYLLDLGNIYDLREGMSDLFKKADRGLLDDVFQEVLGHFEGEGSRNGKRKKTKEWSRIFQFIWFRTASGTG